MSHHDLPTLITCGTGKTGSRVADRLEALGRPVRVGSRSGHPPFDWNDPTTWPAALDGVGSVYVTYVPDLAFPGAAEAVDALTRLAVERGVRRVVLLSGRNEAGAMRGEQFVQRSGADWTIVRCSFFAQNFSEGAFVDAVRAGEIAVPAGNVAEPFIDVDDIADVVVAALTDDRHIGELYELTGPRLLTLADVADELTAAMGRSVRYAPINSDEFAVGLRAAGLPEEEVTGLVDLFTEVFDGRSAYLTDGVQRALGREPRDFSAYATAAAAAGVWDDEEVA
jgi:uncharacterized protein YbjT (DUF2867 family)